MRDKKKHGNLMARLSAAFLAACLAASLSIPAYAAERTYKITLSTGNRGSTGDTSVLVSVQDGGDGYNIAKGADKITVSGLPAGARVSFDVAADGAVAVTDSKYYVKGIRESGKDTSSVEQAASILIDGDQEYVVAYGVKGELVAYTVSYIGPNGEQLAPSRTYYGNVGDKPVVAYLYIDGYTPQAYNLTKTLAADEAENVFAFRYSKNAGPIFIEDPGYPFPDEGGNGQQPGTQPSRPGNQNGNQNNGQTGGDTDNGQNGNQNNGGQNNGQTGNQNNGTQNNGQNGNNGQQNNGQTGNQNNGAQNNGQNGNQNNGQQNNGQNGNNGQTGTQEPQGPQAGDGTVNRDDNGQVDIPDPGGDRNQGVNGNQNNDQNGNAGNNGTPVDNIPVGGNGAVIPVGNGPAEIVDLDDNDTPLAGNLPNNGNNANAPGAGDMPIVNNDNGDGTGDMRGQGNKTKKSPMGIIVPVGLGVLALGGGGAAAYFLAKKRREEGGQDA